MRKHKKLKAYSMLQIMGAILIAGILTALAVPSIMKAVTKAKQGEATSQLEHIYSLERLYFMEFSKYSSDLEEIDFEQQKLVTEDGGARYKIEIVESSTTTFIGRATAVQDFDGDGVFNVWEINQDRTITETVKD
ncbi:MAG: type II secretion system protein [Bacteroidetes bacterium]|nr:type II secretion system protein [Bacteroidota bacterium]